MILQRWRIEIQGEGLDQDLYEPDLALVLAEGLESVLGRPVAITDVELEDEYHVDGVIE